MEKRIFWVVAHHQILTPDHLVATAQGRLQLQAQSVLLAGSIQCHIPFEPLKALQAALGLAAALAGHVTLNIVFLLGDELLLRPKFFHLALVTLGALLNVVAIVARIDLQLTESQLPYLAHRAVHENPVVRDHHDGTLPTVQVPL